MEGKEKHNKGGNVVSIAFAIVVYKEAYFNTVAFTSLTKSLTQTPYKAAAQLFVYDNTDTADWKISTSEVVIHPAAEYYHNPANPGVSVAYNYLAARARSTGCSWIVFLDQDTKLPGQAVEKYLAAINCHPSVLVKTPILMVDDQIFSPSSFFLKRTVNLKQIKPGLLPLKNHTLVNSGLLVNLELFFAVGGYEEKLKLDFADFVFVDKLRKVTSDFEVLDITCQHDFSNNETDISKSLTRYAIFIKDLANCPRRGLPDRIGYFWVGTLHLLKLSFKFKSLRFLKVHFA